MPLPLSASRLDPQQVRDLCGLSDTGPGRALAAVVATELSSVDAEISTNPTICADGDIRRDLRYKLGYREALSFVLGIEGRAREQREVKKGDRT